MQFIPNGRYSAQTASIVAVAEAHGGFITRQQLHALGLSDDAIKHRIARGHLRRHLRGVYAVGHVPTSSLARAHAPLLAVGDGSALAGWSAVNNYRSAARWVEPFTVITPLQADPAGVRTLHTRQLRPPDIRPIHGLRTVTPALASLHVAADLSTHMLTRVIDDFRINDDLTTDDLELAACRFPRHSGCAPLRTALEDLQDEPTRSDWEQEWPPYAAFYKLAPYEMNAYVLQYRVDVLMDGLIIELDGWKTHGSRHAFEHDREEVAEIMAVTGIPVLRITHQQFHRAPAKQAERIRAITARRAA
jgi:hypothetical protein